MNNIKFKNICLKIVIILIVLLAIFFVGNINVVNAENDEDSIGGVLLKPVVSLIVSLADQVNGIIHSSIVQSERTLIVVDLRNDFWDTIVSWIIGIVIFIAVVAVCIATAGAATAILAAIGISATLTVGTTVVVAAAGIGLYCGVAHYTEECLSSKICLPTFSISPEEIFKNQIPAFDVNFFNAEAYESNESNENYIEYKMIMGTEVLDMSNYQSINAPLPTGVQDNQTRIKERFKELDNMLWDDPYAGLKDISVEWRVEFNNATNISKVYKDIVLEDLEMICVGRGYDYYFDFWKLGIIASEELDKNKELETTWVETSSKKIKASECTEQALHEFVLEKFPDCLVEHYNNGKIPSSKEGDEIKILQIPQIKIIKYADGKEVGEIKIEDMFSKKNPAAAQMLKPLIAKWYVKLRNIAIVIMLSILLYIAIRIFLSSVSSDKAKYKEYLKDWLVGMILLFFMHYIMIIAMLIVEQVTLMFTGTTLKSMREIVEKENPESEEEKKKALELLSKTNISGVLVPLDNNGKIKEAVGMLKDQSSSIPFMYFPDDEKPETATHIFWMTNLMGKMRLQLQLDQGNMTNIGYGICYIVLVMFTLFFTFTYIKRIIYLAFLTLIAPLVAMTYPIDKITDGKAQAFEAWLKEYIFNLLIQPLHLVLYTVLVSSAYELVHTNIIYALVAIGFLIPAEGLLRKFFGFSKSDTAGSLAGAAAGGAMVANLMNSASNRVGGGKGGAKSQLDEGGNSKIRENNKIGSKNKASLAGIKSKEKEEKIEDNPKEGKIEDNLNEGKVKKFKNSKVGKAIAAGVRSRTRAVGRSFKNSAKGSLKNLRGNIGRGLGGATLGALGGTIGLAAGIASGDISNVAKFASGGIIAGGKAGGNIGETIANSAKSDGTWEDMLRAYHGDEYDQKQREKQIKKYKKSEEVQNRLYREFSSEEVKDMLKDEGSFEQYIDGGAEDINDIVALEKVRLKQKTEIDDLLVAHKINQRIGGDIRDKSSKTRTDWVNTIADDLPDTITNKGDEVARLMLIMNNINDAKKV